MKLLANSFSSLLRQSVERNPDAFAHLYSAYSEWLLSLIRWRFEIENDADVEDLALDTWMGAWTSIHQFPPFLPFEEKHFLWWLKKLAASQVSKYRERENNFRGVNVTTAANTGHAQFAVFHPLRVRRQASNTMLVYAHSADALEAVQEDSEARLGFAVANWEAGEGRNNKPLELGAQIRIVPELPSCRFSPRTAEFRWNEDWQCAEFRFAANTTRHSPSSSEKIGRVAIYVGPILVAEVRVAITLVSGRSATESIPPRTRISSSAYQTVFASYAHDDSQIVDQLEQAYVVMGLTYFRDVHLLRSGEEWQPELMRHIEEADIFQLFWSKAAKKSRNVAAEWRHALSLNRVNLIRPVYWRKPMPSPPRELRHLHFAYFKLTT